MSAILLSWLRFETKMCSQEKIENTKEGRKKEWVGISWQVYGGFVFFNYTTHAFFVTSIRF